MSTASAEADRSGRKLFVGGLAFEADERDLRSDFGVFGDLEDVQLPVDASSGRHKGFAFITYTDAADAKAAANEYHGKDYKGREISARIVVPREERGAQGGGQDDKHGTRPGDWRCPHCGCNVFAAKTNCFRCGEPKPRDYGGRDDRRGDRDYDRRGDRDYDRRGDRDYDRRGDRDYDRRGDRDRGDRDYDRRGDRDYDRRDRRDDYDRRDDSRDRDRRRRDDRSDSRSR